MVYLTCNNSSVMSLDLSKNTELFTLMCVYNSKLTSIDLSGNRKLSGMQCHNNALKTIDISNTSLLMTDVNYALMGCQNVSVDTTVIIRPKQYAIYSSKWCVKPENARITCDVHYSTLYTPTGLTEIASEAFANSRFDRVSLGYQVSKIGSNAFKDCKMLCQVYFNSYNVSIADDAFTGCTDLTFYCYEGSSAHTYAIEHNIQFVIMPGPFFM